MVTKRTDSISSKNGKEFFQKNLIENLDYYLNSEKKHLSLQNRHARL